MKNIMLTLVMLATLACSSVLGQKVPYKVVEATAVVGLKDAELVGDYIFIAKESEPDTRQVTLLRTEKDADIEVTNEKHEVVVPVDLGKGVYLFGKPGTYIVRLEVLDWDKRERRKTIMKLEVKGGAKPVPANATWKQTLQEIGPYVAKMSKPDRERVASILRTAADNIETNKFLRQAQASDFIKKNRPQSPATSELFAQLSMKAQRDNAKGLQTVMRYYRELADYIDTKPAPRRSTVSVRKSTKPLSFMPKEVTPKATQPVPGPPGYCTEKGCFKEVWGPQGRIR